MALDEAEGEREEQDCWSSWGLVPVELTLQVFSWLGPGDLVRAELVCRRWRATVGPTSPHASFLWRTVHEARFGGARAQEEERPDERNDAGGSVVVVPHPAGGRRTKKEEEEEEVEGVDWRACCLRCERTKVQLWSTGQMDAMVRWTIACGHHALLRHLLSTQPAATLAALKTWTPCRQPGGAGEDHPVLRAMSSGSVPTVDLVTHHVAVPLRAVMNAFELGSSPAMADLLVHRFLVAGGEPFCPVAATAAATVAATAAAWPSDTTWQVEQLDEVLAQTKVGWRRAPSVSELFLLAGNGEHVGVMALLLDRCATKAARQELLQATNKAGHTDNGMSALGVAVGRRRVDIVRALLLRGARASGHGKESVLPLCLAVRVEANRRELVDLLLEHGADINGRNGCNDETCLHGACSMPVVDSGLIAHLLDKGADPSMLAKGWSAMGCLLRYEPSPESEARNEERARAAQLLLSRGGAAGGLGSPDRSLVGMVLGWVCITARHFGKRSEECAIGMLDLLLAHGVSIRSEPLDTLVRLIGGSAPSVIRHLAATQDLKAVLGDAGGRAAVLVPARLRIIESRNREVMRELCTVLGVRLDTGDPPPVHLPGLTNPSHLGLLEELVAHGADINARTSEGRTIGHYVLDFSTVADNYVFQMRHAPVPATLRAWRRLGLDFSLRDGQGRTPAEAFRAWRQARTSISLYARELEESLQALEELQAECER